MTITTRDPNRALWEARARGEDIPTWESLSPEPAGIEQESVDVPAGLWLRPPDAATGPVVLAIHGGGFVSGSVATHRRMFGHLARAAGVATLAVEYGLVPDHVFPSQLDTMLAASGQLLDRGPPRVGVRQGRRSVLHSRAGARARGGLPGGGRPARPARRAAAR